MVRDVPDRMVGVTDNPLRVPVDLPDDSRRARRLRERRCGAAGEDTGQHGTDE